MTKQNFRPNNMYTMDDNKKLDRPINILHNGSFGKYPYEYTAENCRVSADVPYKLSTQQLKTSELLECPHLSRADAETVKRGQLKSLSCMSKKPSSESLADLTVKQKSEMVLAVSCRKKAIMPNISKSQCNVSSSDLSDLCYKSWTFSKFASHKMCSRNEFLSLLFTHSAGEYLSSEIEQNRYFVADASCQTSDDYYSSRQQAVKTTQVNFSNKENTSTEYSQSHSNFEAEYSKNLGIHYENSSPQQQDTSFTLDSDYTPEKALTTCISACKDIVSKCHSPLCQNPDHPLTSSDQLQERRCCTAQVDTHAPTSQQNDPPLEQQIKHSCSPERQKIHRQRRVIDQSCRIMPYMKKTVSQYLQTEKCTSFRSSPQNECQLPENALITQHEDKLLFRQKSPTCVHGNHIVSVTKAKDNYSIYRSKTLPKHYVMMQYPLPERKFCKSNTQMLVYKNPTIENSNSIRKHISPLNIPQKDVVHSMNIAKTGQVPERYTIQPLEKSHIPMKRILRYHSAVQPHGIHCTNAQLEDNGLHKFSQYSKQYHTKVTTKLQSLKRSTKIEQHPVNCTKISVQDTSQLPLWKSIMEVVKSAISTASESVYDSLAHLNHGESEVDAPKYVDFLEAEGKEIHYDVINSFRRAISDVYPLSLLKLGFRQVTDNRRRYGIVGPGRHQKIRRSELSTSNETSERIDKSFQLNQRGFQNDKHHTYTKCATESDLNYIQKSFRNIDRNNEKMHSRKSFSNKDIKASSSRNISNDNTVRHQNFRNEENSTKLLSRSCPYSQYLRTSGDNSPTAVKNCSSNEKKTSTGKMGKKISVTTKPILI